MIYVENVLNQILLLFPNAFTTFNILTQVFRQFGCALGRQEIMFRYGRSKITKKKKIKKKVTTYIKKI